MSGENGVSPGSLREQMAPGHDVYGSGAIEPARRYGQLLLEGRTRRRLTFAAALRAFGRWLFG
jgi:hypothetical protein